MDMFSHEFEKLWVFEKEPNGTDLPEHDIPKFLPEADVVAITGTSITNHTFLKLMEYTNSESYVIVLGPTTPLSPILFNYGVDAVSGIIVKDRTLVKSQVSFARPFRVMSGFDYVTMTKEV